MSIENLKNQIKRIWESTGQTICVEQSTLFYQNLLQFVEEKYASENKEIPGNLLEGIAEKHRIFPFLFYTGYGDGIKNLSVLQNALGNIKKSLLLFITNKYKKTEIHPSTFNQFLYFTQTIDTESELLFMNVLPKYINQNRDYLLPENFNHGLYHALFLDKNEFSPYVDGVRCIKDEYEYDFLSLDISSLYPLKDILFHYAQRAAYEEKYLLMYSWISSQDIKNIPGILKKTSIPPYLYKVFPDVHTAGKDFSDIIRLFVTLSEKASREGLLSLEDEIEDLMNAPVLKNGLQLVVDGTEPSLINALLEEKIEASSYLYKKRLKIITQGLLSIYMGDNPGMTEEILRSLTMNTHTDELENLIIRITNYSRTVRMEGILALEDVHEDVSDILLTEGIKLLVSGTFYDYVHILLTTLSERLIEEKMLYYSLVKSGIMHIACGTRSRAIEKHLQNMVPFEGGVKQTERITERIKEKKQYMLSVCCKFYNPENPGTTFCKTAIDTSIKTTTGTQRMLRRDQQIPDNRHEEQFYNLYRLMTTIIVLKSRLTGFYTYYVSYFTDDKSTPDFLGLNTIFKNNSTMAEQFLAEKAEIPAFTLPLSYKNELLSQVAALEKAHSHHNKNLDEKIQILSGELETILNNTMIILKRIEAERNPSIENLAYLSEEGKIIRFLQGLGELHKKQSMKYESLFSALSVEFLNGITSLSKDIFSFVPDFSGIDESPHLSLTLILHILTKNDILLKKIDSIFPEELAILVRDHLFAFKDIVYITDNGIKEILLNVSNNDLSYALKPADTYIRDKFYKNLTESRLQEIKAHMDFSGPVRPEDVKRARDKIIMYVFRLEEIPSYLAFRAMRAKNTMFSNSQ